MEKAQNELPEELVAFRLVQHFTMQGEASYDDFERRLQALRVIAERLDRLNKLEKEFHNLEEKYTELVSVREAESKMINQDVVADVNLET